MENDIRYFPTPNGQKQVKKGAKWRPCCNFAGCTNRTKNIFCKKHKSNNINKIDAICYKFIHMLKNKSLESKSYPKGNYKKIKDFPNYLIYDDGRVYNIKSKNFRKITTNRFGYVSFTLHNNGISKGYSCHRLVAIHFIPNPNNYRIVDHINHIKTDNNVNNLRWVTNAMNNENLSSNTSGIPGISYCKTRDKWCVNKRSIKSKWFDTKKEAIEYLNDPDNPKYHIGIRKTNNSGITGLSYCNTHNKWKVDLQGIDCKSFKIKKKQLNI